MNTLMNMEPVELNEDRWNLIKGKCKNRREIQSSESRGNMDQTVITGNSVEPLFGKFAY